MNSYSKLASCYDLFMDETPYDQWVEFILAKFEEYSIPKGLVLDLGCGTGTLTELLANQGYDMIGVDASEDMLEIAQDKKYESGNEILYLLQDMREFELYGTVGAIVCVCDSVNYLLSDDDVVQTFRLVNNYLDPEGIFIFDFNTTYKYSDVIGDSTIAENRDEYSFIWENYYDSESRINEYEVTIFAKEGDYYSKTVENHLQRGYTLEDMKTFIDRAGLVFLEASDADTGEAVSDNSERIHIVAREKGKEK